MVTKTKTQRVKKSTSKNRTKRAGSNKKKLIFMDAPGYKMYSTKEEFLQNVRDLNMEKMYLRRKGDPRGVPKGKIRMNDLKGWMKLAGAVWK
jgi:hypothetical protein